MTAALINTTRLTRTPTKRFLSKSVAIRCSWTPQTWYKQSDVPRVNKQNCPTLPTSCKCGPTSSSMLPALHTFTWRTASERSSKVSQSHGLLEQWSFGFDTFDEVRNGVAHLGSYLVVRAVSTIHANDVDLGP